MCVERNDVGLLEVVCDAPDYRVVEALMSMVGGPLLESALDVRWVHRKRLSRESHCTCGMFIDWERYCVGWSGGDKEKYSVAQCARCLRIYWHE